MSNCQNIPNISLILLLQIRNGLMLCIDPSYSCLLDDEIVTSTPTSTPTTTPMSTSTSTPTTTPTTSPEPEIPTGKCAQTKPGKFGTFANPNDSTCHSYIQCNFGLPLIMYCPGRLVFDPVRKVCVWNYQYHCPTMKKKEYRKFNGNGNEYKDHQYEMLNDIM